MFRKIKLLRKMENISQFKAKMTEIGSSRYILIPNKVREYEGINDEDLLIVTVRKVPSLEDYKKLPGLDGNISFNMDKE